MKSRIIIFTILLVLVPSSSCRPKVGKETSPSINQEKNSEDSKKHADSVSKEVDQKAPTFFPSEQTSSEQKISVEPNQLTYVNLQKNIEAALANIPPPQSMEDFDAIRILYRKMLDQRRDLLFSIPVSTRAEKDRKDAWGILEFREKLAIFNDDQYDYAKNLMNSYFAASVTEKLVVWEVVRTRIEYKEATNGTRGLSGTAEILLRREMAKLLFSALGIERQELFDAVDLKTRWSNNEAASKASQAEEEIERLYAEQEKVAEKILEQHWILPP